MYYSYEEIFKQGDTLAQTMDCVLAQKDGIQKFLNTEKYDEIVFLACGSSYWASMSAAMTFQEQLKVPCTMVKSGDVVMNPDFYKTKFSHPLLIAPSRSGSTSETMIAVQLFKETYHAKLLSLVEYENAPILQLSDYVLQLPWANETSICQTRSFSNLYLGMILIAAIMGEDNGLIGDLTAYIEHFFKLAEKAERQIKKITAEFKEWDSLVALGNGKQYGTVVEGAYINIEMAQLPAHYYATLEWRHGPIVISNPNYLVVITSGDKKSRGYEEKMAADTRYTGAKVLSITGVNDFENSDYRLSLGWEAFPETIALYSVMVMQGIAHYQALNRGVDPDHPGELCPWISI